MAKIVRLDPLLITQIAAGEVIERPASIVKELVENALDAGAGRIRIDLAGGGIERVQVVDDGCGMDVADAVLSLERHATSKIASIHDLEQVATLGFRGEALASIASIARVELTTASVAGEGHSIRAERGSQEPWEPAPHPRGTTVDVSGLFSNVPARRKFLKSARAELRRCTEVVQGYALARPGVGFSLRHEGRLLLETPPASADLLGARQRIADIFGSSFVQHLQAIDATESDEVQISGFVGDRSTVRGRRYFTYVNRRLLRDRAVMATYYRAVRDSWRTEEFPALFLFLDLPPAAVDVNVHPQKSEVRFRDAALLDRVGTVLREALQRSLGEAPAPLRPSWDGSETPLVWQGLGQRGHGSGNEIREGEVFPAPSYLSSVVYKPLEPRPVPLSGRADRPRKTKILGQYKASLILLESPDGLLLVDQHAAHERILFERLQRSLREVEVAQQPLVDPFLVELAPAESMRLGELAADLEQSGFSVSQMSGGAWALRTTPAGLSPEEATAILEALVAEETTDTEAPTGVRERLLHTMAAGLSCRAAIKIHRPLGMEEMESLIEELFRAAQPYACPHGRPTILKMSDADLERRFRRR